VTTTVQVKMAAGFTDETAEMRYADAHGLAHRSGQDPHRGSGESSSKDVTVAHRPGDRDAILEPGITCWLSRPARLLRLQPPAA
jgi:hypothetical protein